MPDIKSQQKPFTDNIIEGEVSRNYSNDPVFKKRAEEAKAYLKKHGLYEKFIQLSEEKKTD